MDFALDGLVLLLLSIRDSAVMVAIPSNLAASSKVGLGVADGMPVCVRVRRIPVAAPLPLPPLPLRLLLELRRLSGVGGARREEDWVALVTRASTVLGRDPETTLLLLLPPRVA